MKCWPLLPPSIFKDLAPSRASSLATPITPSPHSSPRAPQPAGNPPSAAPSKLSHSASVEPSHCEPFGPPLELPGSATVLLPSLVAIVVPPSSLVVGELVVVLAVLAVLVVLVVSPVIELSPVLPPPLDEPPVVLDPSPPQAGTHATITAITTILASTGLGRFMAP